MVFDRTGKACAGVHSSSHLPEVCRGLEPGATSSTAPGDSVHPEPRLHVQISAWMHLAPRAPRGSRLADGPWVTVELNSAWGPWGPVEAPSNRRASAAAA